MNGKIRASSVIGGARNFGRRDLLKSAGGFGAFAAVQGILPGSARAASPKSGGHLRVGTGFGSTTDSLDPATTEHGMTININYTYANNLMEVGNDGSLVNELAEQHETEDGKTWYFRLRKGVEFHNGKTLTPDDVVASFEHHIRDGSRSAAKGLLRQSRSRPKHRYSRICNAAGLLGTRRSAGLWCDHIVIGGGSGNQPCRCNPAVQDGKPECTCVNNLCR